MVEKKGRCPVHFLWDGQGLMLWLKKAALMGLLVFIAVKLLALVFHWAISSIAIVVTLALLWSLWKILAAIKRGAQKRTRTSTK